MEIIKLTDDYELKPFDCGDADLNGFLMNDAKPFSGKRIGNTYIVEDKGKIIAYFCLLNDKISKQNVANGTWRKVKKNFPHEKHFSSYPSVKIGRFAVSAECRMQGYGSRLITLIKHTLYNEHSYSAFRFLTVDAYLSAVSFYEKNDFKLLLSEDASIHTRMMYFDMLEL